MRRFRAKIKNEKSAKKPKISRLAGLGKDIFKMIKILFICHGNICRSPMAEFVFKAIVADAGLFDMFHIESAATSREEIGNDIHPGTRQKLIENNVPFAKRGARQITKADYDDFDYLIGMDDANVRNIRIICGGDPEGKVYKLLDFAGKDRSIADPWYTGNFDETYDDVIEGCEGLMKTLM